MARKGPAPKPTNMKLLSGTFRKDRATPGEPTPKIEVPSPPSHLDAEARREWKRISVELARLGLVSKIDRAVLALYCQTWSDWTQAREELKGHGRTVKSPNGYEIPSPHLTIANAAGKELRALAAEFGMSPASRTRVKAEKPSAPRKSRAEKFFAS